MKLTKKLTVIALAFLMIFAISGCNGLKIVKEIASVDGRTISEGEFKYYLENVKNQMQAEAGLSSDEEIESFWDGDIDGEKAADVAKNKALEEAVRIEIANILAEEAGITVDTELKNQYKSIIEQGQADSLKETTGLDNDALLELVLKEETAKAYASHLAKEKVDEFTPNPEEVAAKYQEEYVRVKHIFISKTDLSAPEAMEETAPVETADETEATTDTEASAKEYEEAQKLVAAEVFQKVQSGANFEALIAEYNEDPGMEQQPDGYTFTKNSGMVQAFEDAAFALEIGEISEIVEQAQGWHIIKRYDLLSEGEEYTQHISTITSEMSTDIFNAYIDSLKANYTINIDQGAVDGIKIK